jgi:hypothetical protein
MRFRSLLLTVFALAVFVVGCDKATDPANEKPVIAVASVSVPAANFNDTCNVRAYTYASTVQALIQMANLYGNPQLMTQVNGVWTYTMTEDGVTVTITAQKQSDGQYTWRLKLNGTDTNDGTVYTNWTAMEATSSADGKSGTLRIYSDSPTPSTTVDVQLTWSTGANNVVTVTMEFPQENMRFVLVSNGTTGEVTEYMRTSPTSSWVTTGYHATWTAPGALATC